MISVMLERLCGALAHSNHQGKLWVWIPARDPNNNSRNPGMGFPPPICTFLLRKSNYRMSWKSNSHVFTSEEWRTWITWCKKLTVSEAPRLVHLPETWNEQELESLRGRELVTTHEQGVASVLTFSKVLIKVFLFFFPHRHHLVHLIMATW